MIDEYFDYDKWNEVVDMNKELKNKVRKHLEPLINNLLTDLDLKEFDGFTPPTGELVDDSDKLWLYDSGLGYVDQLMKYKKHKSK